jgi:hypothetical protein
MAMGVERMNISVDITPTLPSDFAPTSATATTIIHSTSGTTTIEMSLISMVPRNSSGAACGPSTTPRPIPTIKPARIFVKILIFLYALMTLINQFPPLLRDFWQKKTGGDFRKNHRTGFLMIRDRKQRSRRTPCSYTAKFASRFLLFQI